ncbi:hypothetical protein ACTMU2_05505 [Cupriavidus basilensis]
MARLAAFDGQRAQQEPVPAGAEPPLRTHVHSRSSTSPRRALATNAGSPGTMVSPSSRVRSRARARPVRRPTMQIGIAHARGKFGFEATTACAGLRG